MRCIVTDTGPLLHLKEVEALGLLSLAGQVFIPQVVAAEMGYHDPGWATRRPAWIEDKPLAEAYQVEAASWYQAGLLDPEEAEAIALARQLQADWFLTDDAAARLVAQEQNLEVHGTLGIVLWAAATGHLGRAEAEEVLNRLSQSSLWVSARILAEARTALALLFLVG